MALTDFFFVHQCIFTQWSCISLRLCLSKSVHLPQLCLYGMHPVCVFLGAYVVLCCDTWVQSLSLISGISDEPVQLNQYANDCRAAQSCQSGMNPLCCTEIKSVGTREKKDDRGGGREGDSQEVGGVVQRRRRRKERMWKWKRQAWPRRNSVRISRKGKNEM